MIKRNKALFIDRDGVINIDKHYVYKVNDFIFQDGIFELLRLFNERDYLIFIITNQSGIGRGYYSIEDFKKLSKYMIKELKKENITIKEILYCPHTPNDDCNCRKPKTGMIDSVKNKYSINLTQSYIIGDNDSDIACGVNSNIKYKIKISNENFKFKEEIDNYFHCKYINEIIELVKKIDV